MSGASASAAGHSRQSSEGETGTGIASGPASDSAKSLYEILNVRPCATAAELKAAYRQLSQRYHPDKHTTESAKAAATHVFTQVKEAYEILSSEKLRRIYNEFGLEAARSAASPELELVPYSELAQRFRSDAWNEKPGAGNRDAGKDAYFTVSNSLEPRIDASGLLIALEDGFVDLSSPTPIAVVTQIGLVSNATAYISQRDTLSCRYSLSGRGHNSRSRSDPGVGDIEVTWRRQLDNYSYLDTSVHSSVDITNGDEPSISMKAFRSLSNDMSMSCESSMRGVGHDFTTALSAARSFSERCSASVSWAIGARGGYAFTWVRNAYDEYVQESSEQGGRNEFGGLDEDEEDDSECDARVLDQVSIGEGSTRRRVILQPFRVFRRIVFYIKRFLEPVGLRWSVRMNGADVSLSFVARRPLGENAPLWKKCRTTGPGNVHAKVSGVMGVIGWEIKCGFLRRFVLADTELGTSIGFGTVGVIWRLKAKRGAHSLSIPIVLQSGYIDTRTAILASLLWSAITSSVELMIVGPWRNRIEARERSESREARKEELLRAKEEAEQNQELMQIEVSRIREAESNVPISATNSDSGGLLIERAIYGWSKNVGCVRLKDALFTGKELEMEVIEVTDAVQVLVDKSAVQIVSRTKCTLAGFWDPTALGEKEELVLRIWYRFKGNLHECTIQDDQPIELPLSSHRVSRWF